MTPADFSYSGSRAGARSGPRTVPFLAVLALGLALSLPAFSDGGGHGQGRGSFSTGRHAEGGGGGRNAGGYSGRHGDGGSAGRNGGGYSGRRVDGGGRSLGTSPGGNRTYGGGPRTERSVGNGETRRSPATTFRSNPRPGFQTTRPDFGTGNSERLRGARPGFSTRPDLNGRPGFDHRYGYDRRNDRPGTYYRPPRVDGYRGGGNYYARPHWRGGYWNGRFWPRAYYRPHYVSFWPTLPSYYSTYWWGGVSYYYVDDLYYTWSPARYGYVVTAPPPAAERVESGDADVESGADDAGDSGSASIYVYPRNGQSEQQTADDRYECHQWAVSQTGFDPTTATPDTQTQGTAADYRRAIMACLDARGYSAN